MLGCLKPPDCVTGAHSDVGAKRRRQPGVGDPPFQRPQRFFAGLGLGDLSVVLVPSRRVRSGGIGSGQPGADPTP
jgi:hypothetical protein